MLLSDLDASVRNFQSLKNRIQSLKKKVLGLQEALGIRNSLDIALIIISYNEPYNTLLQIIITYGRDRLVFEKLKKELGFITDIMKIDPEKIKSYYNSLSPSVIATDKNERSRKTFMLHICEKIEDEINRAIVTLESEIKNFDVHKEKETKSDDIEIVENESNDRDAIDKCLLICERFHLVAKQLGENTRNDGKNRIFVIADEYNLQNLLHAVLHIFFDDIRTEEYTPSYAGSSTRMDFLLKQERIVIEIKMASESFKDKKIGEDLILDIAHYKVHPDCGILICLVYDPYEYIRNPSTLEIDLSKLNDELEIIVKIVPKRA